MTRVDYGAACPNCDEPISLTDLFAHWQTDPLQAQQPPTTTTQKTAKPY